ncbi:MAG: methylmalonyl Co-A mutase-associated GTPase MeaB [Cellvibrionaceae bacterium]
MGNQRQSLEQLISLERLCKGDRRTLAKSITLVESQLAAHQALAQTLLEKALPYSGNSIRIGISGIPGVGKSTFIEAFGLHLVAEGYKVAVLAVDPSSPIAGGSILGDKTRMEYLSREPNAYIRPSPAAGELGGVAQKTRESLLLCEAAGFDVILVETVGVGQSEYHVAGMVDFFLVLMQPNTGDELQGIKKGIVELADALVINKADGELEPFAEQAKGHYQQALDLLKPNAASKSVGAEKTEVTAFWKSKVMTCSALMNRNIDTVWNMIQDYCQQSKAERAFENKRTQQNIEWMESLFRQAVLSSIAAKPGFNELKTQLKQDIGSGKITPLAAAKTLMNL